MSAEEAARRDVFGLFCAWLEGQADPPTLEDIERVVAAHGVYPVEAHAEEWGREALLTYLGAAWGVGPKARWRDRLRVRLALLRMERLGWLVCRLRGHRWAYHGTGDFTGYAERCDRCGVVAQVPQ